MSEDLFAEFCHEYKGKFTARSVHLFMIEVILALREQVPAVAVEFAEKRKQQLAAKENIEALIAWRVHLWGVVANREPEDNQEVAYMRAVICLLFPLSEAAKHPVVTIDDFEMFMEMVGDFESVFMSFRHLLLGQPTN